MQSGGFDGDTLVHIRVDESTYSLLKGEYPRSIIEGSKVREPVEWCKIKHLAPGIEVLSYDEQTGEMSFRKIVEVHNHVPSSEVEYWEISYDWDGDDDIGMFDLSADRRLWIRGKGWVAASDVQEHDVLQTRYGLDARVTFVSQSPYTIRTYNLTLEGPQAYFAGREGILVHANA